MENYGVFVHEGRIITLLKILQSRGIELEEIRKASKAEIINNSLPMDRKIYNVIFSTTEEEFNDMTNDFRMNRIF